MTAEPGRPPDRTGPASGAEAGSSGPADALHERAISVLQQYWGYPDFRTGQWSAMSAVLSGRDALIILPTGGGKSLCYQVPALLLDGLTLVVSPLVALMDDQVAQLRRRGVRATFINSTLSRREIENRWNEALFGDLKLLYLAPERLQTEIFRARAERLNVSLLAIDEAHCISEWGHNFRPSYLRIAEVRPLIGNPPTMAVTATATPYVRKDIQERLALRSPHTLVTGFDRPNITWSIFETENKRVKLMEVLKGVPGCGIVYAATRRGTEDWAAWLGRQGVSATFYHGGMTPEARSAAQEEWIRNDHRVMVATNAFGMGIDKPDVRVVVHVDLPSSLESYYQEAGRGGRDGGRAYAVLLYRNGDADTPRGLLERSHPDRKTVRRVYEVLCSVHGMAPGECPEGPIPTRLSVLAEASGVSIAMVQSVLELLARQEALQLDRANEEDLLVRIAGSVEQLRQFARTAANPALSDFVLDLLRLLPPEAFGALTALSRSDVARRLGIAPDRVERGLHYLQERELLRWYPGAGHVLITHLSPRSQHVPYDESAAVEARKRSETRLSDMIAYAESRSCRRRFLLGYFGESAAEHCGACDVCLGRHEPLVVTPDHQSLIRHILAGIRSGEDISTWFPRGVPVPRPHQLQELLDWLLQEELVRPADPLGQRMALTPKGIQALETRGSA